MGWSLTGLSEITRCFKTVAHDDSFENIKYNQSDRFCLDGQRLALVKGNGYGTDKSEYSVEIENYQRIVLFYSNSSVYYFKAFTKNNFILTFGFTDDSKFGPVGATMNDKWLLNSIEDYSGNKIVYSYS